VRPVRSLIAVLLAAASATTRAEAPRAVVDAVKQRAQAAGFDGAILIGERDGSQTTLTLGANPVSETAVWRWASITKQLAAVIAMQEVERGRLDLDAPVARYWPEWRAPHAATIRIRDLLHHNSGLPQPDESPLDADGVPAFYRSAAAMPSASAAGFCAGPAKATPPAKFDYNNCDSIVLAEVLARITRTPFDKLVMDRFGKRLGLKSLGLYRLDGRPPNHVKPIGEDAQFDGMIDLGANGASAGAYGTIGDLWKFDRALLGGKLLGANARDTMWRSSRANGFSAFFQWVYPAPLKGCAAPVRIVERQGLIAGIEHRNFLMPETGRALILFSRKRPTGLGDPWEGKGLAFDLLSATVCRSTG
jgi:D-alanyl-D-alanine carboxypeptidase